MERSRSGVAAVTLCVLTALPLAGQHAPRPQPTDRAQVLVLGVVSDWFRRNMRIYTNIVRLIDSPEERVLVVYGAGHLGWLQYALAANPTIHLRKLSEFAH